MTQSPGGLPGVVAGSVGRHLLRYGQPPRSSCLYPVDTTLRSYATSPAAPQQRGLLFRTDERPPALWQRKQDEQGKFLSPQYITPDKKFTERRIKLRFIGEIKKGKERFIDFEDVEFTLTSGVNVELVEPNPGMSFFIMNAPEKVRMKLLYPNNQPVKKETVVAELDASMVMDKLW